MASAVATVPRRSRNSRSFDTAMISLLLALQASYPNTVLFVSHQALTMWIAALPAARSRLRRRVLSFKATA